MAVDCTADRVDDRMASRYMTYGVPRCMAISRPGHDNAAFSRSNLSRGTSATANARRFVGAITSPRAGSCETLPQFTPPPKPGKPTLPSKIGGVKIPSDRSAARRARHALRSSSLIPHASLAVRVEGTSGRGRIGNGCVGDASSPGDDALRHPTFFNREERRTGLAMENEEMSHLRRDDDGRYRLPIARDVHEDGLRRNVVVPQIVMDDLKMPDHLAGRRSECDDRVCILVYAETFPAEVVGTWAAGRHENEPARSIDGHNRPDVRGSRTAPTGAGPCSTRRIGLARRDRVPAPTQRSGLGVVCTDDATLEIDRAVVTDRRADDDEVARSPQVATSLDSSRNRGRT